MASVKELARMAVLGLGMCAIVPVIGPAGSAAFAQSPRFDDARQVVGRTQVDLDRAASFLRGNKKEQDRLRNAQKHLSEVDRHMAKGKFDKDTLDSAIGDIQSVLDHNVLQSQDRDVLMRDVTELRGIRSERG
jgi:hypothetical protein